MAGVPNHSKYKKKNQTLEGRFRHDLDVCSKKKDLSGAISLYESAISQKIRLNQYHFNAFLYICSHSVTDSAYDYGSRIYTHMLSYGIAPTEATITAVARLAAAKGDGDFAFQLVKDLGKHNASPRLRSYGPALFCFCRNSEEADKAYDVEDHMVRAGVQPEEPELAALLKVSSERGYGERVYGYLHKLRSCVRCVSESTGETIEGWFGGNVASEVGLVNWDEDRVREVISRNGGGWHGLGWFGKGNWVLGRSGVDSEGHCCSCGEQLVCVDTDRAETEKFGHSVASLAMEREVHSNFREFQDWLDEHAGYEAIVDGANIGLYQQNFADGGFSISQLQAVVKELYKRSNKWPLVILHKKRIRSLLENAINRELLEEWMAQGVLYGTPYGSNDDWYWLYATVKLKCLLVTNDEMRDHIFELLGSSFFLKWKERHQIRYTFMKGSLKLQMPPSYSLVIQESEKGTWHVPIAGENSDESTRTWLCITRPSSVEASQIGQLSCNNKLSISCNSESIKSDNGFHKNSDSPDFLDNNSIAITGKRKARSTSPSYQL